MCQSEPSKSSVDVSIDVSSVDTRVEKRDYDLRSPNFFDVAKFPTITFKSKRAEVAGEEKLKVVGDLTIRDVTGEVVLDVDGPTKPVKDNSGKLHLGASASSKLNRRDFGVNGAAATVADEVEITIDMELVQAPKTRDSRWRKVSLAPRNLMFRVRFTRNSSVCNHLVTLRE
jgi:polyisoprenoid-binding protein YceI